MTVVAGLAIILNLGLNWMLIPHFQHVAAAAVTVGTELFILCYLLVFVPKDLLARSSLLVLLKAAAGALVMAFALYGLRDQSMFLLVPVGALVYCLSALVLRMVPPEDGRLLKQAIMARRGHKLPEAQAAQQA